MKVLMISGDKNLLREGSDAYTRLQLQRASVEQLDAFVWPQVHSLWSILQAARVGHYDVITAQDPYWRGHLAWHIARLVGAKLNIQVHTDLEAQSWWRRLWGPLQLRHADSVRVVSAKIQKQVQALGITAPIHVLPVFVGLERFRNIVRKDHDHKTILWIGRFEDEKDPKRAIEILKKITARVPDARLIMLGSGTLEKSLRDESRGLSIDYPGWRDPAEYVGQADVVLSTSRHESWGASMVEALAAGVPVVAPDVGIAREAGAIIARNSDLADKVVEVLTHDVQGKLLLDLPDATTWAHRWRETLV